MPVRGIRGKIILVANHSNIDVWQFIAEKYAARIPVMLLYVLQSEGSSPGRQGFKMAVAADHNFCGTIGGGIMEHKFVEMAKSFLQEDKAEQEIYRQVHDKSAGKNQSGMICSGEQTIFIYRIQPNDITAIHSLIDSAKAFRNGTLQLSNAGILFSDEFPADHFLFTQQGKDFLLCEKTGFKNTLHIIGGGHCALALSKLMGDMDFYIKVYEERTELNTLMQNVYAHKKIMVDSYTELVSLIESSADSFVVIMSFGYRTDDLALRALINKEFKYIGVLGSSKKMEKLFEEYRAQHIAEELLRKIHTPIGIQIKSKTATEIAVSIAAEIISVKNEAPAAGGAARGTRRKREKRGLRHQ